MGSEMCIRDRGSGGYYVPFGYDASTNTDADFYLTLRGRLGVLMNGWMLYATGGYLGSETTVSVLEACDVFCTTPVVSGSNSSFRNGWTIGGGLEATIEGPWTAKIEYLYYDLGSVNLTTPAGTGIGANTWSVETEGTHRIGVIGSEFEKQIVQRTPLARMGQPDDIAKVAVFLASDDSAWVTGERLTASGGLR